MRILICVLLAMYLASLEATAQRSLRETVVSSPEVVRTDYDMRAVASPSSLGEAEANGQKLFMQRCALCHDPLGQPSYPESPGPQLNSQTVSDLGEETVRDTILMGSARMPGWRYTLDATQVDQVVAYLKVLR